VLWLRGSTKAAGMRLSFESMHSPEESVKAVRKAVTEGKEPNAQMLDDG